MRHIAFTLIALFIMPTLARAQESAAELAKKLGSGNYLERERAAKMLEQLGKAAMPALRGAMTNADLETQRRAMLLIERIEDRVIMEDLVIARPIRLQLDEMDVADALRELERQMGLHCGATAEKRPIGRLDTGTMPYWQAWQRFRDAAVVHESDYALAAAKLKRIDDIEQERILILHGRLENGPTFIPPRIQLAPGARHFWAEDARHSVRVRVRWLKTDHSIDAKVPHAIFAVEVRPEPRLEIVSMPRVAITKIVSADGKESSVQTARVLIGLPRPGIERFLLAYVGEIQFGGLLHLKAIPWLTLPRAIKEMHGKVHVEATVRPSLVEVPGVLKAVGKEVRGFHGITVKVLATDTSEEGDLVLRLRLNHLQSLAPQTPDQQIIRVRPGVLAVRGAIDVAMERLLLVDHRGEKYRQVKATFQQVKDGQDYDVELHYAAKATGNDEPTLCLTKAPRTVSVEVPFVVRELAWGEGK